jgi:hypothetical protein
MASTMTRENVDGAADTLSDATDDSGLTGMFEPLERLSPSTYIGATLGSIALSITLYLAGRKEAGIFVGLWAPTFLNLGLYLKQLRPSRHD